MVSERLLKDDHCPNPTQRNFGPGTLETHSLRRDAVHQRLHHEAPGFGLCLGYLGDLNIETGQEHQDLAVRGFPTFSVDLESGEDELF